MLRGVEECGVVEGLQTRGSLLEENLPSVESQKGLALNLIGNGGRWRALWYLDGRREGGVTGLLERSFFGAMFLA